MRKLTLATAALLIASSIAATAQTSGTASQDNHKGPAQEGGRTQATPAAATPPACPARRRLQAHRPQRHHEPGHHKGAAQEGGRTQATPGASSTTGGTPMDTTGSTTPRSGTATQDNHKGPAQEGGRTQATPGSSTTR